MKKYLLLVCTALSCCFCFGQQSKAMKDQQKAYDILHNKNADGRFNTSAGGWTMTANINGKPWKANFMYSPKETSRIIGHLEVEFISLPYRADRMTVGAKQKFSNSLAVDINLDDKIGIYGANEGEMVITKVSGDWIEGTFHCSGSAASDDKKLIVISNGYFKIKIN